MTYTRDKETNERTNGRADGRRDASRLFVRPSLRWSLTLSDSLEFYVFLSHYTHSSCCFKLYRILQLLIMITFSCFVFIPLTTIIVLWCLVVKFYCEFQLPNDMFDVRTYLHLAIQTSWKITQSLTILAPQIAGFSLYHLLMAPDIFRLCRPGCHRLKTDHHRVVTGSLKRPPPD